MNEIIPKDLWDYLKLKQLLFPILFPSHSYSQKWKNSVLEWNHLIWVLVMNMPQVDICASHFFHLYLLLTLKFAMLISKSSDCQIRLTQLTMGPEEHHIHRPYTLQLGPLTKNHWNGFSRGILILAWDFLPPNPTKKERKLSLCMNSWPLI